jgi:progranulin
MRNLAQILSIPPSILLYLQILAPSAYAEPWPYNLPAHVKYFPEQEPRVKRNLEVQEQLLGETPVGVRKMSDDEGEMFHLDYWHFDERSSLLRHRGDAQKVVGSYPNATMIQDKPGLPPVLPHSELLPQSQSVARYLLPRRLFARDFQCPGGTSACSAIGRPNACCGTRETCMIVSDTGLGDVGCCPAGTRCSSGTLSGCDTSKGYSSCPGSGNGGCCLPGYQCFGVGCKLPLLNRIR